MIQRSVMRLWWTVLSVGAFLLAVVLIVGTLKTAHAGQVIETPCGKFDLDRLAQAGVVQWGKEISLVEICMRLQAQGHQIAIAHSEQNLRTETARWGMGRADKNDGQQHLLANRHMTQEEIDGETRRRLAMSQDARQERTLGWQIQQSQIQTALSAFAGVGQLLNGWGNR